MCSLFVFFLNDPATTEIYTLSLHDALPISNRPSLLAPISANQMRPSGAATRQWGALFGVGMAYSTMDGLAVSPMATLQSVVAMRITDSLFETSDVRPQTSDNTHF